jgi:hypothetical protein
MQNPPAPVRPAPRPAALKAAVLLAFVSAGLFLLLLGYALLAFGIIAGHPADSSTTAANFAATVLTALSLTGAMLYGTTGFGLLKGRRWAWILGLIVQALNLVLAISAINLEFSPPVSLPAGVSVSPAWYLIAFLIGWIALQTTLLLFLFTPQVRRYIR